MSSTTPSEKNASDFQAIVPGKTHIIAFTNSSIQSNAFEIRSSSEDISADHTTILRLFATQDCWLNFGSNPTAVANSAGAPGNKDDSYFLPGGFIDFIGVRPGEKLAVIRNSANGNLYITEGKSFI